MSFLLMFHSEKSRAAYLAFLHSYLLMMGPVTDRCIEGHSKIHYLFILWPWGSNPGPCSPTRLHHESLFILNSKAFYSLGKHVSTKLCLQSSSSFGFDNEMTDIDLKITP